jgi:hypothetical protein
MELAREKRNEMRSAGSCGMEKGEKVGMGI